MKKTKKQIEHEIDNISDIFDAVNSENYERFMLDFMTFVYQIGILKSKHPEIEIKSLIWKDDGKPQMTSLTVNGEKIIFKKDKKR
jgi:hypothetical protein